MSHKTSITRLYLANLYKFNNKPITQTLHAVYLVAPNKTDYYSFLILSATWTNGHSKMTANLLNTNLNTSQHTQNLCVVFTSSPAKHELKMTPSHCFNPARLMTSSWLAWLQEYTEKPWSDRNTNYQYVPPTHTKHTLALVLASN